MQTLSEKNALMQFTWEELLSRWENLKVVAEDMDTLSLIEAWNALEKISYEMQVLLTWNHNRDHTSSEHKQALAEYHEVTSPQLTHCRAALTRVLQGRNLEDLPADYRRPISNITELALLESKIGKYDAEVSRLNIKRTEFKADDSDLVRLNSSLTRSEVEEERRQGWEALMALRGPRLQHQGEVLIELFQLRQKMVKDAGVGCFQDIAWIRQDRSDCTYEDYRKFREAVRPKLVEWMERLMTIKAHLLGKSQVRRWDANHPFFNRLLSNINAAKLEERIPDVLGAVNAQWRRVYLDLKERQCLDLEQRPNKKKSLYADTLTHSGGAVVFATISNSLYGAKDLFHELTHMFQYDLAKHQKLMWNMWPDYKLGEAFAMFGELVTLEHYASFGIIDGDDMALAELLFFEDNMHLALSNCLQDAFQEKVFQMPADEMTVERLCDLSVELCRTYMPHLAGLESLARWTWLSNYSYSTPFLQLDYTIARLVALEQYERYQQDPTGTLERFYEVHRRAGTVSFKQAMQLLESAFQLDDSSVTIGLQEVERHVERFVSEQKQRWGMK